MKITIGMAAIALLLTFNSIGQVTLPVPVNIQKTFTKETRSTSGSPGAKYWQNTAAYSIKVNFDPITRVVTGTADIDYTNHSPDTLKQLLFKLYPNLYKKSSIRLMPVQGDDLTDGMKITSFVINNGTNDTAKLRINGTNMNIRVTPIASNQTVHVSTSFTYTLNKRSHIRTGEIEPGADFIAYFFPRIAVYDDIDGWNQFQYNGVQEFYNDFCSFDVAITVPANYVVWATGDLNNCGEVFNEKYCQRINEAEASDAITTIIDTTDLRQGNITKQNPFNTWKFSAKDVTDFVFALSDHYIWKSSSIVVDPDTKRRSRVDATFNPKHKDYFEVIDFARQTLHAMSYSFPKWPYPYAHETVFDGLDQMEYPMMVNDNPVEDRTDAITLTDHEIFHTMFPFYMGINETKYAWMDEGWATIAEWVISPMIDTTIVDDYGVRPYEATAGLEWDDPITTLSTEQSSSYFTNAYPKPAFGYLFVRDMLGDSIFTKAIHYYIHQWHGKHPMPLDFFNCMNVGSGKNLNWFWKKWFYDDGIPDLAIQKVSKVATGYNIIIESKGIKPVPVDLTITFADSSTTKVHRSIAAWEKSSTTTITVPTKKAITKVVMGSTYAADSNKKDNIWPAK